MRLFVVLACLVAITYQKSLQNPLKILGESKEPDDDSARILLGWKLLFGANYLTYTITTYVSLTSTLTSLSITRCIPATLFLNAAAQASNCRRKRGVDADMAIEEDAQADSITPSVVEQMKVSQLPASMSEVRRLETPEILSSQDDGAISEVANHRTGRNLYQYVVTVTSTTISYSITTTTWKTTAVMAATSTILCMPFGYSLC